MENCCPQCGEQHRISIKDCPHIAEEHFNQSAICGICDAELFFNNDEVGYCHRCQNYTICPTEFDINCPHCSKLISVSNNYRVSCRYCFKIIEHPIRFKKHNYVTVTCTHCFNSFEAQTNLVREYAPRCPHCGHVAVLTEKSCNAKITDFVKYDTQKLRLELIPPSLLKAVGAVLTYGAVKYADRNWEKGTNWTRILGSLERHLLAFKNGEDNDPESGLPHLWHVACNITFLIEFQEASLGTDDRAKRKLLDRDSVISNAMKTAKEFKNGSA